MSYKLMISSDGDSITAKISGIEYEVSQTGAYSREMRSPTKYFPNDLFKKANYYSGKREKSLNRKFKQETLRVINNLIRDVNENRE